MSNTDRDSMLERWAEGMEKLEQYYEGLYGPPATPATLPSVTDYNGMLEAIADELERARININKHSTTYHDTKTAYTKPVPANTKEASIKLIGGKTIKWNQLCGENPAVTGVTYNGVGTYAINGTFSSNLFTKLSKDVTTVAGHKYFVYLNVIPADGTVTLYNDSGGLGLNGSSGLAKAIQTATSSKNIFFRIGSGTHNCTAKCKVIDLTLAFGTGNEPSTVEEVESIFPTDTMYEYNAGTLMSAGVTEVVSKDSNNATLQAYNIPVSVKALTGYGWSCPGHYNYIDFEAKKFVQEVGIRAYAEGDEGDSMVITDGTNTHYALSTQVETDISAYLSDDTRIEVESGGTLTLPNQNGDDYRIPVPSTETFWVDI